MKRTLGSRKRFRAAPSAAASIQLFPFLAVLLCTMGALILLLVIFTRQARLQAAAQAATAVKEHHEDLHNEAEMIAWRIEQLKLAREKTERQLAESRLLLGHLEDHSRRLREQLSGLQAAARELENQAATGEQEREELAAELTAARASLAAAERQLADAQRAASQRRSYAIVPYRGPHGTLRRPIYVECRADAVVIQPEGIELLAADFEGPLGPSNPLAAALRAAREYLVRRGTVDPTQGGEPYPLLLVRPEGITAYYAARAALKSWGSEFGYELVDADWELAFPPPDAALAQVVREAVDDARALQQRLIAAAPRPYGGVSQPVYRAGPRGVMREDGVGHGHRRPFNAQHLERSGSESTRAGSPGGQTGLSEHNPYKNLSSQPGLWHPRPQLAGSADSSGIPGSDGGLAIAAGPATDASPISPAEAKSVSAGGAKKKETPFVQPKSRGKNWGLRDVPTAAAPITRPIRIDCHADRLVLVPETTPQHVRVVLLPSETEAALEELLSAVWARVAEWGIAGKGMYWRPVLQFHVAPGGEGRFADLQRLLEDSGLGIEER
jgi:hypothetical protein